MSFHSHTPYGGGPPTFGVDTMYLQGIFSNVDRDRSGFISATELQSALSNGSWSQFNPETCRMMIRMFDRQGKGQINFQEFSSLWQYISQWSQSFKGFDRDNSGNIDRGELRQALTQFGYRLAEHSYTVLMRKFDRTGSGRVFFDDFVQLCVTLQALTNAFREKDLAGNGFIQISYEEFLVMIFTHLV